MEAARLISEGKRRAQEETEKASRRAQEITEKGVQDILSAANKKAQIAESQPYFTSVDYRSFTTGPGSFSITAARTTE